jgi:O-antigen biosynthesis protein
VSARLRELAARARRDGPRDVARRLVRRAHDRLDAGALDFPLLPGDVADSTTLRLAPPVRRTPEGPLTVGWVCTPPSAGSGGHTTMFRMVQALERSGHRCRILLYDRHGGDHDAAAAVVRATWPWVRADVVPVDDPALGIHAVDAVVATGWPTAHVVARRAPTARCLYFVQDYEPFFFAHGSEAELAADSYRFGFTHVALGHMVQGRLKSELGLDSAFVPFSCDTSTYGLHGDAERSGVVFYTKPGVARRGYRLGALALAELHRRHPEQPIHVYGDDVPDLAVPVVRHGRLTPGGLDALYNRSLAGLALSFTNISLVAEELLAAGCVPVVNDSADSRADLDNPHVQWAPATPHGLADALCRAVEGATAERPRLLAESVRADDWGVAGAEVVRLVEAACR